MGNARESWLIRNYDRIVDGSVLLAVGAFIVGERFHGGPAFTVVMVGATSAAIGAYFVRLSHEEGSAAAEQPDGVNADMVVEEADLALAAHTGGGSPKDVPPDPQVLAEALRVLEAHFVAYSASEEPAETSSVLAAPVFRSFWHEVSERDLGKIGVVYKFGATGRLEPLRQDDVTGGSGRETSIHGKFRTGFPKLENWGPIDPEPSHTVH